MRPYSLYLSAEKTINYCGRSWSTGYGLGNFAKLRFKDKFEQLKINPFPAENITEVSKLNIAPLISITISSS
jgi:hypothetical protein